jgi:hypothetical protein
MNLNVTREAYRAELAWLASGQDKLVKTGGIMLSYAHRAPDPATGKRIYRSGEFVGVLPPAAAGLWGRYQRAVGSYAQLVTDAAVANGSIVWTSRVPGVAGNATTLALVNPGAPNSPLGVAVVAAAITVNLQTNGAAALVTTASQLIAAIKADPAADALVFGEEARGHNGTGLVTAIVATNLAGGIASVGQQATLTTGDINAVANTSIVYTAAQVGAAGNNIQIAYAVPAGAAVPLTSVLSGAGTAANPYVITVNLETLGAGVAVSTAEEIINHVNAMYGHLVTAAPPAGVAVTGVPLVAYNATTLANGTDHSVSLAQGSFGILLHDVDVTDGNGIGAVMYAGKVLDGRLPVASDAFVRAALPMVAFTIENWP